MKKIILLSALIISAAISAEAKNDNDFRSKIRLAMVFSFDEIKTEDIITPSTATIIYTDSDQNSADIGALSVPINSTDKPITYSSDNPSITVDDHGHVTSDGQTAQANITISCGDIKKTYPVYATSSIRKFALSDTEINMFADMSEPYQLTIDSDPVSLDPDIINWYSGDTSVATVDDNGLVIPNGVGTTSIYAELADGSRTAKCTVYVGLYNVTTKAVFITNAVDKIRLGADYSLSSYIYPDTVKDKSVKWSSSDSNIISVDQNGIIRGAETGTATITVESSNGKKDSFDIEVVPPNDKDTNMKVVSKSVSERIAELSSKPQFTKYDYTLNEFAEFQYSLSPVKYSEDRRAEKEEVLEAVSPSSHASGYGKYQFIDLSQSNNVSVETLNNYLHGKGVLEGKGQQFKDAAAANNISELYLVTHACLETGNGFSELASGVDVNGTVVYNMFGIGAYDSNAVKYGSEYAYAQGWTDVDKAISGGAAWISANYINNSSYKQNTLYKMRWNPDSPGKHQYATDIDWATAQAKTLKTMFDSFPDAELSYEIPLFKGENEFELK